MTIISRTQKLSVVDGSKAYRELRALVTKAGLLKRSYRYYTVLIVVIMAGFFLSAYHIITLSSIPWLILWALVFSFFSVQLAGIMHDAGHRAIAKTTRMNDLIGYMATGLLAMGYSSWKIKHNLHHAHTNQEDEDPDVDMPILSFTKEQYRARRGFQRFLSRYQAYIYYPIGSLLNFFVRITSLKFFILKFKPRYIPEIIWLLVGIVVMFILPFFVFPLAKAVTLFIVVNAAVGFYLLNVFAPNHKGMPVIAKDHKLSFLEQQVMTSRNIIGSAITDFVYLGLNYQIEHHLFPDCPRNNLKKIRPYIMDLCRKMNLEYTEVGIIETNRIILAELASIARES